MEDDNDVYEPGGTDVPGPETSQPADAGWPGFGMPDSGPASAGLPDAGLPDAGQPSAGLPDAGLHDAGLPDAGQPEAGQREAEHEVRLSVPRPETGEARVDAALSLLDDLTELPVAEHPAVFEHVHAQLGEVLGELGGGPLTGRDGS
jgi:hypothetical protein